MWYLAGFGVSVLLFAYGIFRRRRRERLDLDSAYVSKLVWVSLGCGMAFVTLVVPALWLFAAFSLFGGTVEQNLPRGMPPQFFLVILVVGACMTAVYTFFGYRDHVVPYRRVLPGKRGEKPLDLAPDDRPEGESR
jgi:hypothetical protein